MAGMAIACEGEYPDITEKYRSPIDKIRLRSIHLPGDCLMLPSPCDGKDKAPRSRGFFKNKIMVGSWEKYEMPLYEYHCSECKKTAEYLLKFSSPHPEKCELCGAIGSLQKQMSQSAFQLKGTGWYVTDFKNPQKPASSKSDEPAQAKESGGEAAASVEPKTAAAPAETTASASTKTAAD